MAVGDGGFSTKPMGFDKNEVNEYISSLRKKMNEMEADKKANDQKTEEALKLAESADERVKAAEEAGEAKVAEIQALLKKEEKTTADLKREVDSLKKKLDEEKQKMTDMLKSGKGVSAEAKRAYAEIIDKANADAEEIIAAARESAKALVSEAQLRREKTDAKLEEFMSVLRAQIETINEGYKSIGDSASSLLGSAVAPVTLSVPEPAPARPVKKEEPVAVAPVVEESAPAEEKPEAEESFDDLLSQLAEVEDKEESAPAEDPATAEEDDNALLEAIMSMEQKIAEKPADEPKFPEPKSESDGMGSVSLADMAPSDLEADFDEDVWTGSKVASDIAASELKNGAIPLVNPNAERDLFGGDLFGSLEESTDEDMSGSVSDTLKAAAEELVEEVAPQDSSDHSKAAPNNDFAKDLIAQTMTSGNLGSDADEDLLATIRAQEEKFAVRPAEKHVDDLDMDEVDDTPSDEDQLKALLESDAFAQAPASAPSAPKQEEASSNPWEELQKQLEAMEQSGFTEQDLSEPEESTPAPAAKPADNTATPSADDASIWNFGNGDTSSSDSDDDMSGDMFGGFGGF